MGFFSLSIARHRMRYALQRGVVYIEFALVLPVLLLFFAAIFELSKIQNELYWINNAAYQLALTGATNLKDVGPTKIQEAYDRIIKSHSTSLDIEMVRTEPFYFVSPSGRTMVKVKLQAESTAVFARLFGPMLSTSASATVPYLYVSRSYADSNLSSVNPATLFNCQGVKGGQSSGDCRTEVCACDTVSCGGSSPYERRCLRAGGP